MSLTCAQMDVLITFYLEQGLSKALKKQVEEHLNTCPNCKAKFEIIKSMLNDLKTTLDKEEDKPELENNTVKKATSEHFRVFQNNLSAYIDNELNNEESIKIKKYTINNKVARKELEDSYNIRKLMNDSLKKTKTEAKQDYTKNILKKLELEEEAYLGFHPAIKLLLASTITVLILTAIVLTSLSM